MKLLILIIITIYASIVFGQSQSFKDSLDSSPLKFSLTLSTFNHAERISSGTTTYQLTDTSIQVINTPFRDKKGKVLFSKLFPTLQKTLITINSIRLDTLKDLYFNNCVMATSGNEYSLDFKSPSMIKHISLHHYYLKQLDNIVQLINSSVPQNYQLLYLGQDTKQDCTL